MDCPECRAPVPPSKSDCPHCGHELDRSSDGPEDDGTRIAIDVLTYLSVFLALFLTSFLIYDLLM